MSRKLSYHDAFVIQAIPKHQLDDYAYVQERVETLQKYLEIIAPTKGGRGKADRKQRNRVIDSLAELIRFSTICEVADPLVREGIPNPPRQALLGRKKIVQAILDVATVGSDQDSRITVFAYTLLRHVVRHHAKNAALLHSMYKLPVFDDTFDLDRVEYFKSVPVAALVSAMYRDNAALTYGLDDATIQNVIHILKTTGDAQFIDVLSSWCFHHDSVVYNNQRRIAARLVDNADTIVMRTRAKGSSVEINSQSRGSVLSTFPSASPVLLICLLAGFRCLSSPHRVVSRPRKSTISCACSAFTRRFVWAETRRA